MDTTPTGGGGGGPDEGLFDSIAALLKEARERSLRAGPHDDPDAPPRTYDSAVVRDYTDEALWKSVQDADDAAGKRTLDALLASYDTAEHLFADVFASLYKASPTLRPQREVDEAHQLNRELVEQMMATEEWRTLRALTALDAIGASYATRNVTRRLIESVGQDTQDAQHALEREQINRDGVAADLGDLAAQGEEALERGDLPGAAQAASQAADVTSELEAAQENVDAAMAVLADLLPAAGDSARMALRRAASETAAAMADQKAAADALGGDDGALGGGWSPSGAGSGAQALSLPEKIKMARQIQKSPRLLALARRAGRYRILANAAQRRKVPNSREEIKGTTAGRDLSLLLPGELVRLATPGLADGFRADYAAGKLALASYRGAEKQGEGPVIICVDDSGSMAGLPEQCAKAAALAILSVCRAKKRDVAITLFSTEVVADEYFARGGGARDWARLARLIETFTGGGTRYEPWIGRALHHLDGHKLNKADVIVITDGLCSVLPGVVDAWKQKKRERDFSCVGVLIANAYPGMGTGVLGELCDRVHVLPPATEWPDDALEDLFSQA